MLHAPLSTGFSLISHFLFPPIAAPLFLHITFLQLLSSQFSFSHSSALFILFTRFLPPPPIAPSFLVFYFLHLVYLHSSLSPSFNSCTHIPTFPLHPIVAPSILPFFFLHLVHSPFSACCTFLPRYLLLTLLQIYSNVSPSSVGTSFFPFSFLHLLKLDFSLFPPPGAPSFLAFSLLYLVHSYSLPSPSSNCCTLIPLFPIPPIVVTLSPSSARCTPYSFSVTLLVAPPLSCFLLLSLLQTHPTFSSSSDFCCLLPQPIALSFPAISSEVARSFLHFDFLQVVHSSFRFLFPPPRALYLLDFFFLCLLHSHTTLSPSSIILRFFLPPTFAP